MIRRLLIFLIAAVGTIWILRRLAAGIRGERCGQSRGAPRFEGAMVRDRICSTFLPRSRALLVRDGAEEHFFCSQACRDAYLSRHRPAR